MGEGPRRSDRKHKYLLRIEQSLHNETDVLSFKYRLSLNFLYTEAIDWALHNPEFIAALEKDHGRRRNQKHGHFVYFKNTEG